MVLKKVKKQLHINKNIFFKWSCDVIHYFTECGTLRLSLTLACKNGGALTRPCSLKKMRFSHIQMILEAERLIKIYCIWELISLSKFIHFQTGYVTYPELLFSLVYTEYICLYNWPDIKLVMELCWLMSAKDLAFFPYIILKHTCTHTHNM